MPASDPVIGLLILNRNGRRFLSPLYESIRNNGYPNVRTYLIDNCSDDGSVESTRESHPEVKVIRMPQNMGFVMAYNLAMPYAFADGCEWVVWANNDILLDPGCLSEMARAVRSDSRISVVGPAFLAWEGNEPNYYMKGKCPELIPAMQARSQVPVDMDWVEGSFLMVSRATVEAVGPLNPHFFIFWEEADFCRRVRYSGKRVVLVPSARVRHFGGAFSEGRRDARREWLHSRNYYIYTLSDPERNFVRNILSVVYLFAINLKARIQKSPDMAFLEVRAFAAVFLRLGVWHRKWLNDRRGIPPAPLEKGYQGLQPEILFPNSYNVKDSKIPSL
jgi:GT2 family glycosyltransferase